MELGQLGQLVLNIVLEVNADVSEYTAVHFQQKLKLNHVVLHLLMVIGLVGQHVQQLVVEVSKLASV